MNATVADVYGAYLAALTRGDRHTATQTLLSAMAQGVPAELLIQDVIAEAQVEVGHGWQQGEISVASEHRASGIAESALSAVAQTALAIPGSPTPGSRGRAVVACSEGEWHVLPGRMVAEVLRLHGVDATFIGPSVPARDLAETLEADPPPVVGVTCSMPMSLVGAWRTISAAREMGTTVICGGRGFGRHGLWATRIGADHWAGGLVEGIEAITVLAASAAPDARPGIEPDAADEIGVLTSDREHLVDAVTQAALAMWGTPSASGSRLSQLRFDFGWNLDAITAGVLVHDPTVLIEHTRWLESVLTSRGHSPRFAPTALALQRDNLPRDLPVTRRHIDEAIAACDSTPARTVQDLLP